MIIETGVLILGIVLLILITSDVLITTLSLGVGGPITSRFSAGVWYLALRIHRKYPSHKTLSLVGWLLLILIAVMWYLLAWFAWTVVFSSFPGAIIEASTYRPASFLQRFAYTGNTISTLGRGDYAPQGFPWELATTIASTNGFVLVTLTFAYLLPLIQAQTKMRNSALYIQTIGIAPQEVVLRAWNGKDFGELAQHFISLAPMLTEQGENRLTYPMLHYLHSIERSRSICLSIAILDEAMTILKYGLSDSVRPDKSALGSARRASTAFLSTLESAFIKPGKKEPPLPSLERLRERGIPTVSDREFWEATKHLYRRRKLLLTLVENDGWTWEDVTIEESFMESM
ncbi:MAG: ion channel [Cyanobacteriota bacterium]|nr:ion channel [Cyanobacteriota bacterium]